MLSEKHREFLLKLLHLKVQTVSEDIFWRPMDEIQKELVATRECHDALNSADFRGKKCHCGKFFVPEGASSITDKDWDSHYADSDCILTTKAQKDVPVTPPTLPEGSSVDIGKPKGEGFDDDIPF